MLAYALFYLLLIAAANRYQAPHITRKTAGMLLNSSHSWAVIGVNDHAALRQFATMFIQIIWPLVNSKNLKSWLVVPAI